jgi:hypothetical protein
MVEQAGAVDLEGEDDRLGVAAEGAGEAAAVLGDRLGVIVGEDAEVEGVEGRLADPAEPGREGRPGAAEVGFEPPHALVFAPLHRR